MSDEEEVHVSFADLPEAVVHLLFQVLNLPDLVGAACTCSAWYRFLSAVWRGRCLARWHHWALPPPAQDDDAAAWRVAYMRRHQVDATILQLLMTHAAWPTRSASTHDTLRAHGADAVDVLAAAAQASSLSGLFIGLAHQAHMALLMVQGQLAGQRIQVLLAAEAGTQDDGSPGAAEGAESSAAAASSTVTGLPQQPDPAISAEAELDYVLEVALHLAQSLHPLSDMSAVRDIVVRLGDDLGSRMQQAGARPGSREALTLLNRLLFGDMAASEAPAGPSSPAQAQRASGSTQAQQEPAAVPEGASSSGQGASHSGCWSSLWPRNADLHGPDLSTFSIPSDSRSGMGFKGSPEVYSSAAGSCLDSVLSQRSGLPITLAILHRAVGRRVGLDVQLVNMPGHVINRVVLSNSSGGSNSSSAGALPKSQDSLVFVDAFAGREMGYEDVRYLWSMATRSFQIPGGLPFPEDPADSLQLLPDMSARDVCQRMLANLCNLHHRFSNWDPINSGWQVDPMTLGAPLGQLCPVVGVPRQARPFRLTRAQLLAEAMSLVLPPGHDKARQVTDMMFKRLILGAAVGEAGVATVMKGSGSSSPSQVEAAQYEVLSNALFNRDPSGPHSGSTSEPLQAPPHNQLGAGEYPIGTPVRHIKLPGVQNATGIVTWWSLPNREGPVSYNILCRPDGCRVSPRTAASLELLSTSRHAAECSPEASTAGHRPPWAASSCLDTVSQAQQLLRRSWFEAGFSEQLTSFLKSSGQWLQSPDSWGPVLQVLVSCSKGLGNGFEAVMCDAAGKQCFLVPNAFVRYMFPRG